VPTLVCEVCSLDWPADEPEPYHYALAHWHQPPRRAGCLKLSRSRWPVEQYLQRAQDDLGLDHFEGRTWRGFHHHLVLSALAYLFILTRYVRTQKTSGVTWEQMLRQIQPWLLRATGFGRGCGMKFNRILFDST